MLTEQKKFRSSLKLSEHVNKLHILYDSLRYNRAPKAQLRCPDIQKITAIALRNHWKWGKKICMVYMRLWENMATGRNINYLCNAIWLFIISVMK